MEVPYNLEFDNVKYSLDDIYSTRVLLRKIIDNEFSSTSAFLICYDDERDRPQHLNFYDVMLDNMGRLLQYYSECKIAVYDRMTPIEHPEKSCGNCKHFCTHYSSGDNFLCLNILQEGHCIGRRRVFKRMKDDKPKDNECFEWNAKCQGVIRTLKKFEN